MDTARAAYKTDNDLYMCEAAAEVGDTVGGGMERNDCSIFQICQQSFKRTHWYERTSFLLPLCEVRWRTILKL